MARPSPFVDDDGWADPETKSAWIRGEWEQALGKAGGSPTHRALPSKAKQETLVSQMTLVYSEFNAALERRGEAPGPGGRRRVKVDVSELLPAGWAPTRENMRPPQPPQWRIRPSKARPTRVARSLHVPKDRSVPTSRGAVVDQLAPETDNGDVKERCVLLESGPGSSEAYDPSDSEDTVSMMQRANQYLLDRQEAVKILLSFAQGGRFALELSSRVRIEMTKRNKAAKAIQTWYVEKSGEARRRAFFKSFGWPLLFLVNLRAYRKRMHANRIINLLQGYSRVSMCVKFQIAKRRILSAQAKVKAFVVVCKARIAVLSRIFVKEETRIRGIIKRRDRREAIRLKEESLKRLMEREQQRKGHYNIHSVFAERKQAVTLLLAHCDIVQQNYRKNYEHSLALLAHEAPPPTVQAQSQEDQMKCPKRDEVKVKVKVELETIGEEEREEIIVRHMKMKRKQFIELKRLEQAEKARVVEISQEQCKAFLGASSRAETAFALASIDRTIFASNLKDGGVPVSNTKKPQLFLCLTDDRLGPSWRQIVEEAVRRDIASKKGLSTL